MEEFKQAFEKGNLFASGIGTSNPSAQLVRVSFRSRRVEAGPLTGIPAVDYGASTIVAKEGDSEDQGDGTNVDVKNQSLKVSSVQALAPKIEVGKRIPSYKVLNQSDARPSHLQELLPSNGRWRVIVFAGDILGNDAQAAKLATLGEQLMQPRSFLKRFTPASARYDAVFEVLLIHKSPRRGVTVFDFPEAFRQFDPVDGWDYWKIFVDDESYHEGHGQIYRHLQIDPSTGCAVILRPDQHVSYVGPVDDYENLDKFFAGFMIEQARQGA